MTEEFDAARTARTMREHAQIEMDHDIWLPEHPAMSRLYYEYSEIPAQHLSDVAKVLENNNTFLGLSGSPQAKIARDKDGRVLGIEFHPGKLDFVHHEMPSLILAPLSIRPFLRQSGFLP